MSNECVCGHDPEYHFDNGLGFIVCRFSVSCSCSYQRTESEAIANASIAAVSGEGPTDSEQVERDYATEKLLHDVKVDAAKVELFPLMYAALCGMHHGLVSQGFPKTAEILDEVIADAEKLMHGRLP